MIGRRRKVKLQIRDPANRERVDVWLHIGETITADLPVEIRNSHGNGTTMILNLIVEVLEVK
jgi:hypothetical protein